MCLNFQWSWLPGVSVTPTCYLALSTILFMMRAFILLKKMSIAIPKLYMLRASSSVSQTPKLYSMATVISMTSRESKPALSNFVFFSNCSPSMPKRPGLHFFTICIAFPSTSSSNDTCLGLEVEVKLAQALKINSERMCPACAEPTILLTEAQLAKFGVRQPMLRPLRHICHRIANFFTEGHDIIMFLRANIPTQSLLYSENLSQTSCIVKMLESRKKKRARK